MERKMSCLFYIPKYIAYFLKHDKTCEVCGTCLQSKHLGD